MAYKTHPSIGIVDSSRIYEYIINIRKTVIIEKKGKGVG
jgi:hypothetical protein